MLLQNLRKQTGQGVVEYALLLAFVVGIGLLLTDSGLGNSIQQVYARVAAALGGDSGGEKTYAQALAEYGQMSMSDLRNIDNADRIALDRAALMNLTRHFLGMTKEELKSILHQNPDARTDKPGLLLFDYDVVKTGDEEPNGAVVIRNRNNGGNEPDANLMIDWLQGNSGTEGNTYFDSNRQANTRYFFSDDTISPNGVFSNSNTPSGAHSSTVRANFTFDSEGRVDSVTTTVYRNIQNSQGKWERDKCEGLQDITVTK